MLRTINSLFLAVALVLFTACDSIEISSMKVETTYPGVQEMPTRYTYTVELTEVVETEIDVTRLWYNDEQIDVKDYQITSSSKATTVVIESNAELVKKGPTPPERMKGAALIEFEVKGKKQYVHIMKEQIEEVEPVALPASNPNNDY